MDISVHLDWTPAHDNMGKLRANLLPSVNLTFGSHLPRNDYDILVSVYPRREHFLSNSKLRSLIVARSYITDEIVELAQDFRHVTVHHLDRTEAPTVEMAAALLLTVAKRIILPKGVLGGKQRRRMENGRTIVLEGKGALILGYGAVGRGMADFCHSLGLQVTATRLSINSPRKKGPYSLYPASTFRALLPSADVIVVSLPKSKDTIGLLGEQELALLPRDAVLIDVSGGEVVDAQALYYALQKGHLFGAGISAPHSPEIEIGEETANAVIMLSRLENVLTTLYQLADPVECEAQRTESLARLLNSASKGIPMANQVETTSRSN